MTTELKLKIRDLNEEDYKRNDAKDFIALSDFRIELRGMSNGGSDHRAIFVTVNTLGTVDGKLSMIPVNIVDHNIWGPNTPISLMTFQLDLGIELIPEDIRAKVINTLKSPYVALVEANPDQVIARMQASGEQHSNLLKSNDLVILQEVPDPNKQPNEYAAFTKSFPDHIKKEPCKQNFFNLDNGGKHGGLILAKEGIHVRLCTNPEDLGNELPHLKGEDANKLFEALNETKYKDGAKLNRAYLSIITDNRDPESVKKYAVVNLHTDWNKVGTTLNLLKICDDLGIIAAGDTNIQTESEFKKQAIQVDGKETQSNDDPRTKELQDSHFYFKEENVMAIPSGNSTDIVVVPGPKSKCFMRQDLGLEERGFYIKTHTYDKNNMPLCLSGETPRLNEETTSDTKGNTPTVDEATTSGAKKAINVGFDYGNQRTTITQPEQADASIIHHGRNNSP